MSVFNKIQKKFHIKRNRKRSLLVATLGILVVGGLIFFGVQRYKADTQVPTPLEQLQAATKPNFKPGNALPPLSRWFQAPLSLDVSEELTKNWGYALSFSSDGLIAKLDDPESSISKMLNLAANDPDHYPISFISQHYWLPDEKDNLPESAWTHTDSPGTVRTRSRTIWSNTADVPIGTLRQYSSTGHAPALVYKCIQSIGSKDNPPTPEGNAWWVLATDAELDASPGMRIWSLEAPTSIFEEAGATWAAPIITLKERFPTIKIAIILNGSEYGWGELGSDWDYWKQDPAIWTASGETNNWADIWRYYSTQYLRRDLPIATALRATISDNPNSLYIDYAMSSVSGRITGYIPYAWGPDYSITRTITDMPSMESYYSYEPSWTRPQELLTRVTNQVTQQIALGDKYSYDFLSAGWRTSRNTLATTISSNDMTLTGASTWTSYMPASGRAQLDSEIISYSSIDTETKVMTIIARGVDGTTAASHPKNTNIYRMPDAAISDPERYMGFLKIKYTLGTIGACQFYGTPDENDSNWLWQFMETGHVHALYSWLEDYLRNGDLLPGPNNHKWSTDLPAYEFPNTANDQWARVVARKKKTSNDWLIAAWAQDGTDRNVTVTIPVLGTVTVNARVAGSVYTAKLVDGQPVLTLMDVDALNPTDGISGRVNDGVNPPAPIANLNKTFTYKNKMTISGTKSVNVKKVLVNQKEATVDNNANTWSIELDLLNGQNTLTILGQDDASKSSSTTTKTITRRKVGDFNNDTKIDGTDFTLLLFNWGSVLKNNFGDFNEDGKVDGSDFTLMLYWWGK